MEVPGHSFPCLAEARWWFVVHMLYQLGTYVNPVYTSIWVDFARRRGGGTLAVRVRFVPPPYLGDAAHVTSRIR
jgi:hypothetical protein